MQKGVDLQHLTKFTGRRRAAHGARKLVREKMVEDPKEMV
jgi:hypothetical protein